MDSRRSLPSNVFIGGGNDTWGQGMTKVWDDIEKE